MYKAIRKAPAQNHFFSWIYQLSQNPCGRGSSFTDLPSSSMNHLGVFSHSSSVLFFRVHASPNFRQQGGILHTAKGGVFSSGLFFSDSANFDCVLHSANISTIPPLLHYSNKRRWGCSHRGVSHLPCTGHTQYPIQPLTTKPTILSALFGQTLSVPQELFCKSELPHPHVTAPNPNGEPESTRPF